MTEKRCPDCKHTRGIGYDFWCGEGHTEYEVFGAETNCPFYEFHDWSKGTPSRTEKRFKTNEVGCIVDYEDNLKNYDGQEIVDLLNEQHKTIERLKHNITELLSVNIEEELLKENEQLKQQIGELQYSKKMLRATNKDLELGIHNLRKSFEEFDNMRIKHIKFLQKRMKKHGISIYYNDDGDM